MRLADIFHIISRFSANYLFWCILLIVWSSNIYSQDSIPTALAEQLEKASERHPAEAVYVQTSKGIYETGEDLWFKGYVLDSQYLMPSIRSKILYVQLLRLPEKEAVWKEKYAVKNGFVNGHVYVQDSLESGEYALIAQTSFSVDSIEETVSSVRKVEIVQSASTLLDRNTDTVSKKTPTDSISFNLLPEGGHLVSDIPNKIAFKAVDKEGNPREVSGTLFEDGKALLQFKSRHAGMGSFSLIPHHDKRYHVKLEGNPAKYPLPEIKPDGQVLQLLQNTSDTLSLKLTQSPSLSSQTMYIRIQVRGVVQGVAEIVLEREKLIKIPVDDFPGGIAEIALFNRNLEPVIERLVFVNQDRKLFINASTDKSAYLTKEKVKLKIQVTDEKGDPVVAHLGASVYDNLYHNPKDPKTIETHYQLSTQLKGRIYDPGYYFDPEHDNRKQDLDLLMLTQGWRAYRWSEANLKQKSNKKRSYLSDTLIGKVYAQKRKAESLVREQYVMAFAGDPESDKTLLEVDSLGRYMVLPEYLQQEERGYVYFKLLTDTKSLGINIDDPAFDRLNKLLADKRISYPLARPKEKKSDSDARAYLLAENMNTLDEVVLTGKRKQVFRDKYMGTLDSLAKYEGNTDYVCQSNVLNCPIHENDSKNRPPVEGESYIVYTGFKWNADRTAYTIKGRGHVTYHLPKYSAKELLKKFNLARVKGYYPEKEFYSPVYDKEEDQEGFTDYRNTLYWKPDIITDENGESEIEFYTSDLNTKFQGSIEGVSAKGLLGNQSLEFKVKER